MSPLVFHFFFFFFNDTATTEIYTLSLHDALPICTEVGVGSRRRHPAFPCRLVRWVQDGVRRLDRGDAADRKSTRLNSSHLVISYAVFCLKKKKRKYKMTPMTVSCSQLRIQRRDTP